MLAELVEHEIGSLFPYGDCIINFLKIFTSVSVDCWLNEDLEPECRQDYWGLVKAVWATLTACLKDTTLPVPPPQKVAELVGGIIECIWFDSESCQNVFSQTTLNVNTVTSWDPNDKVGYPGYGTQHFIPLSNQELMYIIYFENLDTVTAPAQEVTITDQLDTTNLDLNTFSFNSSSFADKTVTFDSSTEKSFSNTVDLRPDTDLLLNIQAKLETNTGLLTWYFKSIDPDTGDLPEDPMVGFLPPNVNPPEGEGSVIFTIQPRSGLATGTKIQNKASIVFDTNSPIETSEVFNTIDSGIPTSSVSSLSAKRGATNFKVKWTGSDDEGGSGMKNYDVYVSDDGGSYTQWLTTSNSSAIFTGEIGHKYSFYSRAKDNAGNIEDAPLKADAVTEIVEGGNNSPS